MASMYAISVPVFIKHLNGMDGCLKKAQALYKDRKYDEVTLMNYRLYPDMFSFTRQIQAMTDHAKGCAALLAGMEVPKYDNTEKNFNELLGRIEKTIAFLNMVKPAQVDGSEDKAITIKMPDRELKMKGIELLLNRSMPNFFFHATTAYDIMRHQGVELGKRDFMGNA